jgi:hypothetical protein
MYSGFHMKKVLNRVYRREGITTVLRLSILIENHSQRGDGSAPESGVFRR